MGDDVTCRLNYADRLPRARGSIATRLGLLAAIVADVGLLAAIFTWNEARIWAPYLHPPMTIYWAQPMLVASLVIGVFAAFAVAIGLLRPGHVGWKIVAIVACVTYWAAFSCVVFFGLM